MKGFGSLLIVMALGFLALLVIARLMPHRRGWPQEVPRATWPLTRNEQSMRFCLQGALPDLIVLSQVSFGALLTARATAVHNTFDRKRADFVVCEKSFKVVAIVDWTTAATTARKTAMRGATHSSSTPGIACCGIGASPTSTVCRRTSRHR